MSKYSLIKGLIHKSINANPESWRLFFNKYQIPQSNPEIGIVRAYKQHGTAVTKDLNNLLVTKVAAFTGENKDTVQIIGEWIGISAALLSGNETDDTAAQKLEQAEIEKQKEIEAQERKKRNLIIGFGVACAIVVIVFIAIKHR